MTFRNGSRLVSGYFFFDQEPSSSLFSTISNRLLHLSIKTSKKKWKTSRNIKDSKIIIIYCNWVHFSSGPLLSQAPRQALATQWVALATVLKRWLQGFGANLRKFWIETLFVTSANPLQVAAVGRPLVGDCWSLRPTVAYNSSHARICWIHSSWRWCQSRNDFFLPFYMKKKTREWHFKDLQGTVSWSSQTKTWVSQCPLISTSIH